MSQYEKVKQFHKAFNLPVMEEPQLPDFDEKVHIKNDDEDYVEDTDAVMEAICHFLGMIKTELKSVQNPDPRVLRIRLLLEEVEEYVKAEATNDIVEIADGLADINYITNGTAVAYGIPLDPIFDDVHENNMSKLGPDGKPIVVNGKVIKPDHYKPVDLGKYFKERV